MTGILPNNGVPPAQTQNGIAAPLLGPGCENLYYGPRCNPRMDPFAMNAVISEIINALNAIGVSYDCSRLDNLAGAFLTFVAPAPVIGGGAPNAILQHRVAPGTPGGPCPTGVWTVRPLNLEAYDPLLMVTLAGNAFSVSAASYITWDSYAYDTNDTKTRLWNITDGVVADIGMNGLTHEDFAKASIISKGSAFIVPGKSYQLQMFCNTNPGNEAFGVPFAASGQDELYAQVFIWRTV